MPDFEALFHNALASHDDAAKWQGAPFEKIKRISNTKVGDVGQDFIEQLCIEIGLEVAFPEADGKRKKQSPWDIQIGHLKFELKTATEDVSNSFQFNHIRYHRPYEALICLAIAPDAILFNLWSKADVTTDKAGRLVSMEKGANASYKLTKRRDGLLPIATFEETINSFLK